MNDDGSDGLRKALVHFVFDASRTLRVRVAVLRFIS
jgi:hypothetical protein